MAPKKTPLKDLKPKSTAVKGGKNGKNGRIAVNDNITLVRAAKPVVKKDFPPNKGGKKVV